MSSLTPYIFLDGNCAEAMRFYEKCLGGNLHILTYGETQGDACPAGAKDRVIHAALKTADFMLMASDTPGTPEHKVTPGSNVQLALNCNSLSEIEKTFKALSEKGKVVAPLHDAFWGAKFGMLIDRYGFYWMLTFEKDKK